MTPTQNAAVPPSLVANTSSSLRVLCVDDNRDCADSTTALMRAMGYQAQACYDGHTALVMNDVFRPEVCFLDLDMPLMNGDELTAQLLARSSWQPRLLVAFTGMNDEDSRARMRAAGAHFHVVKGSDPGQLLRIVESMFRKPGNSEPGTSPLATDSTFLKSTTLG